MGQRRGLLGGDALPPGKDMTPRNEAIPAGVAALLVGVIEALFVTDRWVRFALMLWAVFLGFFAGGWLEVHWSKARPKGTE